MQTVFSQRLLAGLRILRDEEEIRGNDTFQNPDDRVDPDDSGPRLSVTFKESSVDEIYPAAATQPPAAAGQAAKTEQTNGRHSSYYGSIKSAPIASYSASRDGGRSCTAVFPLLLKDYPTKGLSFSHQGAIAEAVKKPYTGQLFLTELLESRVPSVSSSAHVPLRINRMGVRPPRG